MIDRNLIQHTAKLAKLHLSEEEISTFAVQLQDIIEYVNQLNEVNTSQIEPASHALPIWNVFRDDVTAPSLPLDHVLQNAPDREDPFFKVPQILTEN